MAGKTPQKPSAKKTGKSLKGSAPTRSRSRPTSASSPAADARGPPRDRADAPPKSHGGVGSCQSDHTFRHLRAICVVGGGPMIAR